jgi:SAM-dependent methyltransferase
MKQPAGTHLTASVMELENSLPEDAFRVRGSRVLNLGCGSKYVDGAVNLDVAAAVRADVKHDLNRVPWPFPDNQFSEVLAYDVIEHCTDVIALMNEIHRVCSGSAVFRITVPHFSCANAFTDPTHRHCFGWSSFEYFTSEHEFSFYTDRRFRERYKRIIFHPGILNKVIWRIANRFPAAYEHRWAWIFPAWYLYFELEALK